MRKKDQIKAWYKRVASTYDKDYEQGVRDQFYEHFYLKPMLTYGDLVNKKILELGCGTGRMTKRLARYTDDLTAIDISDAMLKEIDMGIETRCIDMDEMDFESDTFDIVTATGSLECVEDLAQVFNEVYRVLKRGGKFLFSLHNKALHISFYTWVKSFNRKTYFKTDHFSWRCIKKLLKASGFTPIYHHTVYFLPYDLMPNWFKEMFLKQLLYIDSLLGRCMVTKAGGAEHCIGVIK